MDTLDDILKGFDLNDNHVVSTEDKVPLTIWVPKSYKQKYADLQLKSHRKFGKKIQEIFMTAVDKVYPAAS
jgi:hypothetical protein